MNTNEKNLYDGVVVLIIVSGFILGFIILAIEPFLKRWSTKRKEDKERQKKEEEKWEALKILKTTHPLKSLAKEEIAKLPFVEKLDKDFLEKHPFGFKFLFRYTILPEITFLGEIVESKDALMVQVGGAMLGLPLKFINKYIVQEI